MRARSAWEYWNAVLGKPRYVLAPMVNASELPFRLLCRKYGCDLTYTPMLHSRLFVEDRKYAEKFHPTVHNIPEGYNTDNTIAQFCGNDPSTVVNACKKIEDQVAGVDLNCGCPQGIARRGGYGSYLLDSPDIILSVVAAMVKELRVPVFVKIRIADESEDEDEEDEEDEERDKHQKEELSQGGAEGSDLSKPQPLLAESSECLGIMTDDGGHAQADVSRNAKESLGANRLTGSTGRWEDDVNNRKRIRTADASETVTPDGRTTPEVDSGTDHNNTRSRVDSTEKSTKPLDAYMAGGDMRMEKFRECKFSKTVRLVKALEGLGVCGICIHARTKKNKGHEIREANWCVIKHCVAITRIPIIANGSISNKADADACLAFTGAAAVMSAEALLEDPSMFSAAGRGDVDDLMLELIDLYEKLQIEFLPPLKAHLFHALYAGLQRHTDLRDALAASKTTEQMRQVAFSMKNRRKSLPAHEKLGYYMRHRRPL